MFHLKRIIGKSTVCNLSYLYKQYNLINWRNLSNMGGDQTGAGVTLQRVIDKLEEFAPTSLAESWDNVGLLLEPAISQTVTKILLTNDLTEDVAEEALSLSANLIISYHPPIFAPLKRITNATWKERILLKCMANNIAIYSPHTSWDVVDGGVNDWLASAFLCSEVKPLIPMKSDSSAQKSTYILVIESVRDTIFFELKSQVHVYANFELLFSDSVVNSSNYKFTVRCDEQTLKNVVPMLQREPDVKCYYVNPEYKVSQNRGIGRMCKLKTPISIRDVVDTIKKHIGVSHIQLALARKSRDDNLVQTIAFVAGSGGSLLKNIHCDLKVTGEASHHEILDSIHNGSSVLLTNHSNSERGYLTKFKELLATKLENPAVQIFVSMKDADPLKVY